MSMQLPQWSRSRTMFGQAFVWPANEVPTTYGHQLVALSTGGVPQTWGVQIQAIYNIDAFDPGEFPKLRADVKWGVLGARNVAQVDMFKGASFNVVADNLEINAVDESSYIGGPPTVSPFTVMASASPMPFDTTERVVRTISLEAPIVGSEVIVPPFAKTLNVTRFDASSILSNYQLEFWAINGLVVGNTVVGAGGELQNYNLPGDTDRVVISAIGGDVTRMRFVFGLDL